MYGTNLEKYSNDAFLGLPTDVLGMEYFAVVYYPSKDENQFLIVGKQTIYNKLHLIYNRHSFSAHELYVDFI